MTRFFTPPTPPSHSLRFFLSKDPPPPLVSRFISLSIFEFDEYDSFSLGGGGGPILLGGPLQGIQFTTPVRESCSLYALSVHARTKSHPRFKLAPASQKKIDSLQGCIAQDHLRCRICRRIASIFENGFRLGIASSGGVLR